MGWKERNRRRTRGVRGSGLVGVLLCGALATGCIQGPPSVGGRSVPPSPQDVWVPPAEARPRTEPVLASVDASALTPAMMREAAQGLTMSQVVDLALRNNSATRVSWLSMRAAADAYGQERGRLLPTVTAGATALTSKQLASSVRFGGQRNQISPNVNLSWLVLDLGGRSGSRDATREATYAAGFTHDAVIQGAVLQAESAYFGYMATQALLEVQRASVEEAEVNLEAAQHRHDVGLATIADVLQARTAASQARLAAESTGGLLQAARAGLAVAMGVPANTPFELAPPPDETPVGAVAESVDSLIERAVASRPDLAAAQARSRQALASARATRSRGLPSIQLTGNGGRVYSSTPEFNGGSYTLSLGLSVPVFSGFSQSYSNQGAEDQALLAQALAGGLRQQVIQQVFTSYYALQTATQRVHTSDDLLASAQQSEDVALGRYQEGVGTILDLLTAQKALADARAQQSQARWSWLLSLAQLAHDGGVLGVDGTASLPVVPDPPSPDSPSTPLR